MSMYTHIYTHCNLCFASFKEHSLYCTLKNKAEKKQRVGSFTSGISILDSHPDICLKLPNEPEALETLRKQDEKKSDYCRGMQCYFRGWHH